MFGLFDYLMVSSCGFVVRWFSGFLFEDPTISSCGGLMCVFCFVVVCAGFKELRV